MENVGLNTKKNASQEDPPKMPEGPPLRASWGKVLRTISELAARGKPSTWFPRGGLVELVLLHTLRCMLTSRS